MWHACLPQVDCPGSAPYCPDDGGGLSCPFNGQCVGADTASGLSSLYAISGSSTSSSSSSGLPTTPVANPDDSLIATLVLNGVSSVTLPANKTYVPCPGTLVVGCELGATATLKSAGDMNTAILACADRATASPPAGLGLAKLQPYAVVGLKYCGIDTTVPGTYTVTFTLQHAIQPLLSVSRQVVVQAACLAGEDECNGKCVEAGQVCGGSSSNATSSSATAASLVTVVNQPPSLALITTAQFGSSIQVWPAVYCRLLPAYYCLPACLPTTACYCLPTTACLPTACLSPALGPSALPSHIDPVPNSQYPSKATEILCPIHSTLAKPQRSCAQLLLQKRISFAD